MFNRYDKVEFKKYNGESNKMEVACTVSLVDGKLIYEGKDAQEVKKMVDRNDRLADYRDIGGYTLLAALPYVFTGDYFYATDVIEASLG